MYKLLCYLPHVSISFKGSLNRSSINFFSETGQAATHQRDVIAHAVLKVGMCVDAEAFWGKGEWAVG